MLKYDGSNTTFLDCTAEFGENPCIDTPNNHCALTKCNRETFDSCCYDTINYVFRTSLDICTNTPTCRGCPFDNLGTSDCIATDCTAYDCVKLKEDSNITYDIFEGVCSSDVAWVAHSWNDNYFNFCRDGVTNSEA